MRTQSIYPVLIWILIAPLLNGCSRRDPEQATPSETTPDGIPVVYSVNYPLQYFASRIGGEAVHVVLPPASGFDPSGWEPDTDTVTAFQQADWILLNGADYAKWLPKVSLRESRLIDTSAAFKDQLIPLAEEVSHSHGNDGLHSHTGVAFTTWLDPRLAIEHARAILPAFQKLVPGKATLFQENFTALEQDLKALDSRFEQAVALNPTLPLLASHPVYQYLQRRYQLNLLSLHWEPDALPTEAMWNDLNSLLKNHPAQHLIWEAEPDAATRDKLSGRGIRSLVFHPCGGIPESGDYLQIMQGNVERLEQIFRNNPPSSR